MNREIQSYSYVNDKNRLKKEELDEDWSNVIFEKNAYQSFLDYLCSLKEQKYKDFVNKLIPQVNNMIGIRLPILQEIAKQVAKGDFEGFLSHGKTQYFEEVMIHGFVIGKLKNISIEVIQEFIRYHVPKLDNWSTCDSFCASLKIAKKYPKEMFDFILPYAYSNDCYEIRFFIVMCLNYYINEEYVSIVDEILQSINSDEYYVNMAICWAYTVMFQIDSNRVLQFLNSLKSQLETKQNNRNLFILQKTISKICDSRKITAEKKAIVRSYHV
ncbi:DNA alkylation repair protein [Lachnoclostridium sp.]|uniref:DNA alkylation repair protein n=1 Tax=Lachnoclostridium sp. TaxID=2028282 RepID=UPI00289E864B|nr:DNA alkylation repair protein [Lachnoclostridium sp.]